MTVNQPDPYHAGREDLVEYLQGREDVVDCLEYGRISDVGVSDMDIIVVLCDQPRPDIAEHLATANLPQPVRMAMAHASVIVVNESDADGIFYWDDLQARSLFGKTSVRQPLDPLIESYRRTAMVIDWFFERLHRVNRLHETCDQDARRALGVMKSFCYAVENFRARHDLREGDVPYEAACTTLYELRHGWAKMAENDRRVQLMSVVRQMQEAASRLSGVVFSAFASNPLFDCDEDSIPEDVEMIFPDGMRWVYRNRVTEAEASAHHPEAVILPKSLLAHLWIYCAPKRSLSSRIRAGIRPDIENLAPLLRVTDAGYARFLEKRIGYANNWFDFLSHRGFRTGLYKFGWYLR